MLPRGATYSFKTGSAGVWNQSLIAFFQSHDALVHYTPHPQPKPNVFRITGSQDFLLYKTLQVVGNPPERPRQQSFSVFISEFEKLLCSLADLKEDLVIVGNFNNHVEAIDNC